MVIFTVLDDVSSSQKTLFTLVNLVAAFPQTY